MTPEQIALVQSSFRRLGPAKTALAARFYHELFSAHPELRKLVTADMEEQQIKFTEQLAVIVHAIPKLDELLMHTRALGARHLAYGVRTVDYRYVGDALIAALAQVLGDGFDAQTRQAWLLAYNLVAETMLDGASSARPAARLQEGVVQGAREDGTEMFQRVAGLRCVHRSSGADAFAFARPTSRVQAPASRPV
ncbi:MAG TPA: globin domain-containing protein [Streptosporangiaceae bacterium]|jgi:nitric oxide dioxygenase